MSSDVNEASKRKRPEVEDEKPSLKTELQIQPDEKSAPPAPPPPKRQKSDSDSSDSDCISQEDLLAQLGLNSVKKLKAAAPNSKKVVHPEPPKQSILEFLKFPVVSRKVESPSVQPPQEKPLTNGYVEGGEDAAGVEAVEDEESDGDNIDKKEKLIVQLQGNLRNEEAKLLLLRKLYACQNDKPGKAVTTPAALTTGATTVQAQPSGQRKTVPVAVTQKHQSPQQSKVQSSVQPRVVFLTQPRAGQPVIIAPKLIPVSTGKSAPLRDTAGRGVRPLHASVAQNLKSVMSGNNLATKARPAHPTAIYAQSSIGGTGAANKSSAAIRAITSAHNDKMRLSENGLTKSAALNIIHVPQPPSQADAKLALRKQLERTLLQIPLPKPPVQDWNFVPSVNTQDFTILVGLDSVVNHILESKETAKPGGGKAPGPALTAPRFCTHCDTDFTPVWRKKPLEGDSSEKKVIVTLCDMCCTQKTKKTLKADHTTRLKAAFVKALKQEQEVEQKFLASGGVKGSKVDAAVRPSSHHVPSLQGGARVVYHHPSVHHSLQPQQVFQPHHSIVHQLQQQQLQQQELESGGGHHQQQDTRYFTYVGGAQHNCQPQHAAVAKQRGHNYTTGGDHDRQREYLLDMIPSGHASRGYRI